MKPLVAIALLIAGCSDNYTTNICTLRSGASSDSAPQVEQECSQSSAVQLTDGGSDGADDASTLEEQCVAPGEHCADPDYGYGKCDALNNCCAHCLSAAGACIDFPSEEACGSGGEQCAKCGVSAICFDGACRKPCNSPTDCKSGVCKLGFCYGL